MKRGGLLEHDLELVHDQYRKDRLAWVAKSNPSMRVVKGKPIFASKGAPDFVGCLDGGRAVAFDAKSTEQESWPFNLLELHQAKDLESARLLGAASFLVIRTSTGTYVCDWLSICDDWFIWYKDYRPGARAKVPRLGYGETLGWPVTPLYPIEGCDWLTALNTLGIVR